uniref:Cytochrome c oxidase subunit 7B, mitochondrial n=1 Tax=Podarcis muralis TaxID=64176 RepID=A0A670K0F2_PODMU
SFPIVSSCVLARGVQRTAARQVHHKHGPDFHDKYGNLILLGGALFCVSIWSYSRIDNPLFGLIKTR